MKAAIALALFLAVSYMSCSAYQDALNVINQETSDNG